jgi:hypothetical protein
MFLATAHRRAGADSCTNLARCTLRSLGELRRDAGVAADSRPEAEDDCGPQSRPRSASTSTTLPPFLSRLATVSTNSVLGMQIERVHKGLASNVWSSAATCAATERSSTFAVSDSNVSEHSSIRTAGIVRRRDHNLRVRYLLEHRNWMAAVRTVAYSTSVEIHDATTVVVVQQSSALRRRWVIDIAVLHGRHRARGKRNVLHVNFSFVGVVGRPRVLLREQQRRGR